MSMLVTVAGLAGALYIAFTLSATGWSKLANLDATAVQLSGSLPFIGLRTARLGISLLAVGEVSVAAGAAFVPRSIFPALFSAGLFMLFAVHNGHEAFQGREESSCSCTGGGSPASTALVRVTANAISLIVASWWAAAAEGFPSVAAVLFAIAFIIPVGSWTWRVVERRAAVRVGFTPQPTRR